MNTWMVATTNLVLLKHISCSQFTWIFYKTKWSQLPVDMFTNGIYDNHCSLLSKAVYCDEFKAVVPGKH